jgi:hypothetical protein
MRSPGCTAELCWISRWSAISLTPTPSERASPLIAEKVWC